MRGSSVLMRICDPGWLFLLAGLATVSSAVVVSALDELAHVTWQRQQAMAVEAQQIERIDRHRTYLQALQAQDPVLMSSLAASQLHLVGADDRVLALPGDPARASASVFEVLEPEPIAMPSRQRVGSRLESLVLSDETRPWLIAAGGLMMLVGLLPPSRRR